jgi:hypothetical protein
VVFSADDCYFHVTRSTAIQVLSQGESPETATHNDDSGRFHSRTSSFSCSVSVLAALRRTMLNRADRSGYFLPEAFLFHSCSSLHFDAAICLLEGFT